jgi:hypothetical protein
MPLQATSGAASYDGFGGGVVAEPNYIESVFSTYLYTGTSATRTITNGVDLSTKGGLVWIKSRTSAQSHILNDTARGAGKNLLTDSTSQSLSINDTLTAFGTTGFTLGADSNAVVNGSGQNYVSWSLREQPKFFDIVTWTGNGTNRTISHNLGSVPACILVKSSSGNYAWAVYHSSLANTEYLVLNTTAAKATDATYWNSTTPTSTEFSIGTAIPVNNSGADYVAYLFASNAGGFGLTGTDNVISCGSFTTDGSGNATVDLGYEPQWVLLKSSSNTNDWAIADNMRGWTASGGYADLNPNLSNAEDNFLSDTFLPLTATGFKGQFTSGNASKTYIYIAIRRGPMKVPTSGTSVFSPNLSSSSGGTITTNFPVDLSLNSARASSSHYSMDRLRGASTNYYNVLVTNTTAAEDIGTGAGLGFDNNTGFVNSWSGSSYVWWNFRRAPSFFDEVCYTGTGANRTVTHNLGVVPEMIIVKSRSSAQQWSVYTSGVGPTGRMPLQLGNAADYSDFYWNDTAPTASVFTVGVSGTTNLNGATMVAYLFATCAGVSKVTSFTGNGSSQTINCGFTAGSRFVMIKRTDSTGDWYVWDSARGIVSGNDPHLSLNSTAAEVTTDDTIDTDSTGFIVNQVSATNCNVNGASYIVLAIA